MKTGDKVMTPRFCTVTIEAVFDSYDAALAAGYKEPTHYYNDAEYGVLGKSLDTCHMTFAAYRKGATTTKSTNMKRDFVDVHAEMDAAAAMLFIISQPLLEDYNHFPDRTIGEALHGIACTLQRIDETLCEIELETGATA